MANILPPDRLKTLRKAQRARLLFAASGIASIAGLLAGVALVPSFLAVRLEPHAESAGGDLKNASSTNAVLEAQSLIAVLQSVSTTTKASLEAMQAASALRPSGVSIDHIDYTRGATGGTIVVSGVYRAAGDIDAYRSRLSSDDHFTQVNVPVSALAGATNGRFAITLTGHF